MGCYPVKDSISKLKTFQERFKAFLPQRFEEEKSNVVAVKHRGDLCVWKTAWAECQDVKQKLEEKLWEFDGIQKPQRSSQKDVRVLGNADDSFQASSPSITNSSWGVLEAYPESEADSQTQSQDSHARRDSEAVRCLNLHYKPEGKASKDGNALLVVPEVCSVITSCKEEFSAELLSQTQTEKTQTKSLPIRSSSEQNSPSVLQNQLKEPNHPSSVAASSIDNSSALQGALTVNLRTFLRKHHSEPDLKAVHRNNKLPWKQALGRSHSEGTCVCYNPIPTCCPLPRYKKHTTDKPSVLLDDPVSHQDRLCSDCSNIQAEWTKISNKDEHRISQDDQHSPISRHESFCSSVSSPRQGWVKEGENIAFPLAERSTASFPVEPIFPDRLELENTNNLL